MTITHLLDSLEQAACSFVLKEDGEVVFHGKLDNLAVDARKELKKRRGAMTALARHPELVALVKAAEAGEVQLAELPATYRHLIVTDASRAVRSAIDDLDHPFFMKSVLDARRQWLLDLAAAWRGSLG